MKLFLLNTPRYLNYYISMLEDNNERGILVVIGNMLFVKDYVELLKNLKESLPFVECIVLSARYHNIKNNDWHKIKHRKESLKRIKQLFNKYQITTVITSNDGLLFSQYAIYLNKNNENIYLEDGLLNYVPINFKKPSIYSKLVQQKAHKFLYPKLYFKDWRPLPGTGSNPWITKLYFSYPNLTHYPKNKETFRLSKKYLIKKNIFSVELLKKHNLAKKTLTDLDVIILFSEQENNNKVILESCQHLNKYNIKIGIKTHPNDHNDYSDVKKLTNIFFLPEFAFEIMFPLLAKKTIIIGEASTTALMLAYWLLDNKVFCFKPLDYKYNIFYKVFKKLAIAQIDNIKNIPEYI